MNELTDLPDDVAQISKHAGLNARIRTEGTQNLIEAIWIADAHRDDGKRFVVHADEKLTTFRELEAAIRACGELV